MASSMPWTGKGVCTSQRVYPASRTFSAAAMVAAAADGPGYAPVRSSRTSDSPYVDRRATDQIEEEYQQLVDLKVFNPSVIYS